MRRTATTIMAVAVVLFTAGLSAQSKPSFAGKWVMQQDPNGAPPAGGGGGGRGGGRGGGGGWGPEFTATQDGTTLKIERTGGAGTTTDTYKLDGSESKNQMTMGGRMGGGGGGGTTPPAPMDIVSKATWVGNNIQIVTMQPGQGGATTEIKRTLSIGADGLLTIETSRPGPDGTPVVSKVTYKKG